MAGIDNNKISSRYLLCDFDVKEFLISFTDDGVGGHYSDIRYKENDIDEIPGNCINTKKWLVLEYLNDESFFKIDRPVELTKTQREQLDIYKPTLEQKETLIEFITEALLVNSDANNLIPCDKFSFECRVMIGSVETGYNEDWSKTKIVPCVYYACKSAYDLFLCECFEMLRRNVKISQCWQCNKYFFSSRKTGSKFCSPQCRTKHSEIRASEATKIYRTKFRVMNKYFHRSKLNNKLTTKEKEKIEIAYNQWVDEANSMKWKFENGEIAESEYKDFMQQSLKEYAGLENEDDADE